MRNGVVAFGTLLVVGLALGTFCTVGKRSHYTCMECGLYFQDRVMFGIGMATYQPKPRTIWFLRRIATPHDHRWSRWSCTAGLNLWQSPTYFACGLTEPLVRQNDWLAKILNRLELLDLDRKFHGAVTHGQVEHRSAAVDASTFLDPGANDLEVRAWWAKTERFLASPGLWSTGFRSFEQ